MILITFFLHTFVAFLTPIPQFVRLRVVWEMDYIKERRLLDVLSLAHQNFATFDHRQCKATVDVYGICLYPSCTFFIRCRKFFIHIGVGFCVARSGDGGQCEGLDVQDE